MFILHTFRKTALITSIRGSGGSRPKHVLRVQTRIDRMEFGNFGDHKSVGGGVSELRIDFGAGYRLYYGRDGDEIVILPGGGTKNRQARDIAMAQTRWKAYQQEKRNARKRT